MELIDYVRMLGRRWIYVVVLTLLGLAAGLAWGLTKTPTYTATAELFVGNVVSTASASPIQNSQLASQFTLARMDTYASLVDSPSVTKAVAGQLRLGSKASVGPHLSATVPGKTVLLRVTATAATPVRAASMANAAATALGASIEDLEKGTTGSSPVRTTLTRPATAPGAPSSPNRRLDVAFGLIIGLGLGLMAAGLRDQAGGSRDTGARAPAEPSPRGRPVAAGATAHGSVSPDA